MRLFSISKKLFDVFVYFNDNKDTILMRRHTILQVLFCVVTEKKSTKTNSRYILLFIFLLTYRQRHKKVVSREKMWILCKFYRQPIEVTCDDLI